MELADQSRSPTNLDFRNMMFDYDELEVQENADVECEMPHSSRGSFCHEASISSEVSSPRVGSACSPLPAICSPPGRGQENAPSLLGVEGIEETWNLPISETSPEDAPPAMEQSLLLHRSALFKLPSVGTWWMQRRRSSMSPTDESISTFLGGMEVPKHDPVVLERDECFHQEQESPLHARPTFHSRPSVASWFTRLLPNKSFQTGSASPHWQPLPVDTGGAATPHLQPVAVDKAVSEVTWSGDMAEGWGACPMRRLAKVHSCASMLSKPGGAAEVRQLAAAVLRDFLGKDADEPLTEKELRTLAAMGKLNIFTGTDVAQPH